MSEGVATAGWDVNEIDLRDIFECAPCGYAVLDEAGTVQRVNQTLASWLEQAPDAIEGQRFSGLLSIAGKIYYETHFAPLLRMQGFFHEVALDMARKDRCRCSSTPPSVLPRTAHTGYSSPSSMRRTDGVMNGNCSRPGGRP